VAPQSERPFSKITGASPFMGNLTLSVETISSLHTPGIKTAGFIFFMSPLCSHDVIPDYMISNVVFQKFYLLKKKK
jgi:hypothetical protein